jgi:hypothetical protein
MNGTTTNPSHVGWVAEPPHGRGTVSLLYSCLFTIYICTWSAVHLNVPADDDASWEIKLRKVKWMVVAILAPEYAATNAFRDWTLATTWLKEWSDPQQEIVSPVTFERDQLIHRFYIATYMDNDTCILHRDGRLLRRAPQRSTRQIVPRKI